MYLLGFNFYMLSKYSFKTITIFVDRAQNARPCIIFFDEFDSIAPRLVI